MADTRDIVRKLGEAMEAARTNSVITVTYHSPRTLDVSLRDLEDESILCTPEAALEILASSGFILRETARTQLNILRDGKLVYARPLGTGVYHPPEPTGLAT